MLSSVLRSERAVFEAIRLMIEAPSAAQDQEPERRMGFHKKAEENTLEENAS